MFGKIVLYKPDRGFGFIRFSASAEDLFFHVSELVGDQQSLRVGAQVEFTLGQHKRKPVAREVQLLEEARAVLGSGGVA